MVMVMVMVILWVMVGVIWRVWSGPFWGRWVSTTVVVPLYGWYRTGYYHIGGGGKEGVRERERPWAGVWVGSEGDWMEAELVV